MNTTKTWIGSVASFLILCYCAIAQSTSAENTTQPSPESPTPSAWQHKIRLIGDMKFLVEDNPVTAASLSTQLGRPYEARQNRFLVTFFVNAERGLDLSVFLAMAKDLPDSKLTSEGAIEMLRSQDHVLCVEPVALETRYRVLLAAPTAEQAGRLVPAFVEAFNTAWPKVRQKQLSAAIAEDQSQIDKLETELQQKKAKFQEDRAVLQGIEPLSDQTNEQLRSKLLMLDVDIAGTKARLEATDRYAEAQRRAEENRETAKTAKTEREHLEHLMITIQIDLASLSASRRELAKILNASERLPKLKKAIMGLEECTIKIAKEKLEQQKGISQHRPIPMKIEWGVAAGSIHPIAWEDVTKPSQ